MAIPVDSQAASPTHSKVITSGETKPSATCIPVVHIKLPSSNVRSAMARILAPVTLPKQEFLPERTMTVGEASGRMPPSTKMFRGLPIAPTMQVIIVDRVTVVEPQLAADITDHANQILAIPVDSQAACPTHSKVLHFKLPSSHLQSTVEPSEC